MDATWPRARATGRKHARKHAPLTVDVEIGEPTTSVPPPREPMALGTPPPPPPRTLPWVPRGDVAHPAATQQTANLRAAGLHQHRQTNLREDSAGRVRRHQRVLRHQSRHGHEPLGWAVRESAGRAEARRLLLTSRSTCGHQPFGGGGASLATLPASLHLLRILSCVRAWFPQSVIRDSTSFSEHVLVCFVSSARES